MLTSFQAYDSHCNIVLGEVEETIYVVEEDENENETIKVGWLEFLGPQTRSPSCIYLTNLGACRL